MEHCCRPLSCFCESVGFVERLLARHIHRRRSFCYGHGRGVESASRSVHGDCCVDICVASLVMYVWLRSTRPSFCSLQVRLRTVVVLQLQADVGTM